MARQKAMRNPPAKADQQGLTLVEMMIRVALVGIACALAAPAYRSHAIGTQVEDGLRLGAPWKQAVADYYVANGEWPSQAAVKDMAPATNAVAQVSVEAGVIRITYGRGSGAVHPRLDGAVLTLVPYTNEYNGVVWQCGRAPAPRGTIAQGATAEGTTLTADKLPTGCDG